MMRVLRAVAFLGALGLGAEVVAHGTEDYANGTGSTGMILPSAVNSTFYGFNRTYGTIMRPTATSHVISLSTSVDATSSTECPVSRVKVTTTRTVTITVDEPTPTPVTDTSAGNGQADEESPSSSGNGSGYGSAKPNDEPSNSGSGPGYGPPKSDGQSSNSGSGSGYSSPKFDSKASAGEGRSDSTPSDGDNESPATSGSGPDYGSPKAEGDSSVEPDTRATGSDASANAGDDDNEDEDETLADEADEADEDDENGTDQSPSTEQPGDKPEEHEDHKDEDKSSSSSLASPEPTSSECSARRTVTVTSMRTVTATLEPVASGAVPYPSNNGTMPTGTGSASASYQMPSLTSSSLEATETATVGGHMPGYKVRRRYHL